VAVIYLELEIDSDIYPELHAALASMSNNMARGERLRQLAATGLIWEQCRAQGLYSQPSPSLPAAAAVSPAAGRRVSEPAAPVPAAKSRSSSSASTRKTKPAKSSEVFVDLALNAPPSSGASPDDEASPEDIRNEILGEARHDAEKKSTGGNGKPVNIPMLSDVVAEAPLPIYATKTNPPVAQPPEAAARTRDGLVAVSNSLPPDAGDGASPSDDLHHHDTSAFPQKAGKRRRLMRMKEMGLFKNG